MITHSELLARLHYNPLTGVWTWLPCNSRQKRWNTRYANKTAGVVGKLYGYRTISINKRPYKSSRLAWFYMTGEWPAELVDHRDRDRLNDRWENLREATRLENLHNSSVKQNSVSGIKGVRFRKNRWEAVIRVDGKRVYLGRFHTPYEAEVAYNTAAMSHHGRFFLGGKGA